MKNDTEYYLKISQDFFERPSMINLLKKTGHDGLLLYLKLMLQSADREGILAEECEDGTFKPYAENTLLYLIRWPEEKKEIVPIVLDTLVEERLATLDEDGRFILAGMEEGGTFVGRETAEARRKRIQRAKKKAEAARVLAEEAKEKPEMEATADEMSADTQDEEETGDDVAMDLWQDDAMQTGVEATEEEDSQSEEAAETLKKQIKGKASKKNLLVTVTDLGDLDLEALL